MKDRQKPKHPSFNLCHDCGLASEILCKVVAAIKAKTAPELQRLTEELIGKMHEIVERAQGNRPNHVKPTWDDVGLILESSLKVLLEELQREVPDNG